MNIDPHWTAYLSALLTPVITVLGAYIAWKQAATARNKLKLDLFDRRYAIYDSARLLLAEVMTKGRITDEALYKFNAGIRGARWLLNQEIADYLREEIWNKACDLQRYDAELEGLPVGKERSEFVQKRADLKKWFYEQHPVLDAKFDPFLQLEH